METTSNENSRKRESSGMTSEIKKTPTKEEKYLNDQHRISFLNQCKLELSAEVIRWKEESLKLQQENASALKKNEELESFANTLARKNHELETSLFLSWEENKRLRMRTLAIGEENSALHEQLSKTMYHSYPWIEFKSTTASTMDSHSSKKTPEPSESWEDVSKQLFQQMQKEMKEMQKLSRTLAKRDKIFEKVENVTLPKEKTEVSEVQALENNIDDITTETETLKKHIKLQNEKLRLLLNQLSQNAERKPTRNHDAAQSASTSKKYSTPPNQPEPPNEKAHSRPSDETFRAYFTQQLSKHGNDDKKVTQVYLNRDEAKGNGSHKESKGSSVPSSFQKGSGQKIAVSVRNDSDMKLSIEDLSILEEKRLCPICKVAFPKSIPDSEFEAHVIAHLQDVGASLLNRY